MKNRIITFLIALFILISNGSFAADGGVVAFFQRLFGLEPNKELSEPIDEDMTIAASESITLNPGFNSSGHNFSAFLSPEMVFPEYEPIRRNKINGYNYVLTHTAMKKMTKSEFSDVISDNEMETPATVADINSQISYFDGLGRPEQQVAFQASPFYNDVISFNEYDDFGRESTKHLPFTLKIGGESGSHHLNDPLSEQKSFYYFADEINTPSDINAKSVTIFDGSPLNRVRKQGAPGVIWQPLNNEPERHVNEHLISMAYETNDELDVALFEVLENGTLHRSGENPYYAAGTLYLTRTTDENHLEQREFKNMQGQVVLKSQYENNTAKLETYYIYDDFGLLRYVLTPGASAAMLRNWDSNDWSGSITSEYLLKFMSYYYEYDARQRMIKKKLPGADEVFMKYDNRDRLILTQDGNQRLDGAEEEWLFTLYDNFNRPTVTGKLRIADGFTFDLNATNWNTNRTGNGEYTFSLPDEVTYSEIYTQTYYDEYLTGYDKANLYVKDPELLTDADALRTKGYVTATKTKVGNSQWEISVPFYDEYGRAVYTVKTVDFNSTTGEERITTKYSFTGQVLETKQEQTFNGQTTVFRIKMQYDHAGRLLATTESIDGQDMDRQTTIMTYDELGQLANKSLPKSLQSINYKYNIRGWLTQMNDPDDTESGNLFAMELLYNHTYNNEFSSKAKNQYNGNIAGVKWFNPIKNADESIELKTQAYSYNYNIWNMLQDAINYNYNDPDLSFSVRNIGYNSNGDIVYLNRYKDRSRVPIDSLAYSYTMGTHLKNVVDRSLNLTEGFKSTTTAQSLDLQYDFDNNGNLTSDANKGITGITYNHLNLPTQVTLAAGTIDYLYSAAGTKYKKTTSDGTGDRYYFSNFEYDKDMLLEYIHTSEGRIRVQDNYTADYYLKDHLGNTRVVYTDEDNNGEPELLQASNYYPFGMMHGNSNTFASGDKTTQYNYNGKEQQNDFGLDWYDYGARFYDAALGRWHVIDNKAEKYAGNSPYTYCLNNPVIFIDPDGNEVYYSQDGTNLGQVGTNTDVRVVNSSMTNAQALTHIQNSNTESLNGSSVAYASYFTTVTDVTNDAALQTYTNNGQNCFNAATAQLSEEDVTQTGPGNAINTKVDAGSALGADPIGGSILIQTQLNDGEPVMVGVEETKADGTSPDPGNTNSATGHFVVIRSITVSEDGTITLNYLDNASTSLGKNANNNFTLNTATGEMQDNTIPQRGSYETYTVTEVRKNQ